MDSFLWWSGLIAWGALSSLGALAALDWAIDFSLKSLSFKREFLAWAWERVKKRSANDRVPAG